MSLPCHSGPDKQVLGAVSYSDSNVRSSSDRNVRFSLEKELCLNVFTAFFRRNLKPAARAALSMLHVARLLLSELYRPQARAPT
jgi:hypothetical protein